MQVRYEIPEPSSRVDEPAAPLYTPPLEYPCFLAVGGLLSLTYVCDEVEQVWILAGKKMDMSVHGFSPMLESFPLQ